MSTTYDPINPTEGYIEPLAGTPGQTAFPSWPPPSGGAPVLTPEMGPILNPYPYGSTQTGNISIAPPVPQHPYSSTFFPKKMAVANGQNQAPPSGWPTWPHSKVTTLPDKAPPSLSQIP